MEWFSFSHHDSDARKEICQPKVSRDAKPYWRASSATRWTPEPAQNLREKRLVCPIISVPWIIHQISKIIQNPAIDHKFVCKQTESSHNLRHVNKSHCGMMIYPISGQAQLQSEKPFFSLEDDKNTSIFHERRILPTKSYVLCIYIHVYIIYDYDYIYICIYTYLWILYNIHKHWIRIDACRYVCSYVYI